MAAPRAVRADELGIYIGGVILGCAQNVELNIDREMLEAACAATGNWRSVVPGISSWDVTIDALWRVFEAADRPTNINITNVFDALVDGTMVEVRFGFKESTDPVLGGYQFVGNAYYNNLSASAPIDDVQTWSASLTGTGELVREPLA